MGWGWWEGGIRRSPCHDHRIVERHDVCAQRARQPQPPRAPVHRAEGVHRGALGHLCRRQRRTLAQPLHTPSIARPPPHLSRRTLGRTTLVQNRPLVRRGAVYMDMGVAAVSEWVAHACARRT